MDAARTYGVWRGGALLLMTALMWALAARAASRVTVTLDPPTFLVNGSAELTITLSGDEDAAPIIPRVRGLVINPDGQSSSIRQVNGAVTATFARTYRVTASEPGTYTIPPIQLGTLSTAPVSVRVLAPGSLAGGAGSAAGGNAAAGGAGGTAARANAAHVAPGDLASAMRAAMPLLKIQVPQGDVYAGELLPIQIKAYFREGVSARLDGPLTAVGDAFTVSGLDKRPTQTQESIGDVPYVVLTWDSVLGALKSGSYPIGLELPVTLNVQLPGSDSDMAARLRALFGTNSASAFMDDSAFGNLFGRIVQRSVTLKPEATAVNVLPLPAQGRPADFTGAVGQFQLASALAPASGSVGDPLTFRLTVTGTGNLSRVQTEGLRESAQWRVYRSDAKVTADDESGLKGYKTFTQPVVPLQAGELSLPAVSFSYFDPQAARYVTRIAPAIPVTVRPGSGGVPAAVAAGAAADRGGARSAADVLAADARVGHSAVTTLMPVVWRSWFLSAALAPVAAMLVALILIRRHQRRVADPTLALHAARLAAVRINLESMTAALQRGDAPAFFSSARHALQERLAANWHVAAESVDRQLVAAHMSGPDAEELQAILSMADRATYAQERVDVPTLQEWQRRILTQMDRLEAVA